MLDNKKIRAIWAWLLSIIVLTSLVGCGSGDEEILGELINPGVGNRGGLQIAGQSVEFKEPERKSIYYLALDDIEKKIYDAAFTTVSAKENTFVLTGINLTSYCEAYSYTLTAFINDHPEFFWLNGYVEYSTYRMSNSDIGNMTITLGVYDYWIENDIVKAESELNAALDSVVAQASNLTDDYQKAKLVHDYIIEFNTYDYEAYELGDAISAEIDARVSSAYGALVSGDVMCAGYARAFDLVMHTLGYESIFVSGEADGGAHAWNLVLLGENFYHIDLTWDDLDSDYAEARYDYFCLTDEEISKTHTIDEGFYYPEATATEYNYFVKEEMILDYYSFAAVTKLAKKYNGDGVFAFKCYDSKVMADAVEELVENNMIFKLAGFEDVESFEYIADEDSNILSFYIE